MAICGQCHGKAGARGWPTLFCDRTQCRRHCRRAAARLRLQSQGSGSECTRLESHFARQRGRVHWNQARQAAGADSGEAIIIPHPLPQQPTQQPRVCDGRNPRDRKSLSSSSLPRRPGPAARRSPSRSAKSGAGSGYRLLQLGIWGGYLVRCRSGKACLQRVAQLARN